MKNFLIIMLLTVLAAALLSGAADLAGILAGQNGDRDTQGTLSFSVRTVTYHGPYAPRNAGAIWITNSQNQFVKTVKIWANQYRYTLVRWNASSGGNTTGAITGASLNSHQLHNVTWNGANAQGAQVADGDYKVNVEFTEHNATASNLGKYTQKTWTKGPDPVNQTIPNETYFTDMTLVWQPAVANGTIFGSVSNGSGNPIAGATVQAGSYSAVSNASGAYEITAPPGSYDMSCAASNYYTQYASGVAVVSGIATEQNFVLQTVANSDAVNASLLLYLRGVQPNPSVNLAQISYAKESPSPVLLAIFNQRGQLVWEQYIGEGKTGNSEFVWDRRDRYGKRCPAGTYLLRLSLDGQARVRKLQLL